MIFEVKRPNGQVRLDFECDFVDFAGNNIIPMRKDANGIRPMIGRIGVWAITLLPGETLETREGTAK